jgi:hypothetical protein
MEKLGLRMAGAAALRAQRGEIEAQEGFGYHLRFYYNLLQAWRRHVR